MRLLVGVLMLSLVALAGFGLAACGGGGSDETALDEDEARQLIRSLLIDPSPPVCWPLADLSIEDAAAVIEDEGPIREAFEDALGEALDVRQYGEIIAEECERKMTY